MRFTADRKKTIIQYMLQKIGEGREGLSHCVADACGIGTSTVHTYINELLQEGVITKSGRDQYKLTVERSFFTLKRSQKQIESETVIYEDCLWPKIKDLPGNVQSIWSYAFSEMINNVIDHSGAENLWVVVEKSGLKTSVMILDDGIGAFRKIQEHFGYHSIEDAVIELSKGKLTTDSAHHSGEGVFFTSRIMDEFLLFSDHKVFSFNKYHEEMLRNIEKEFPFSTCVLLSLSNSTKKQIADVFNEYADVDNGFVKTRIPMKNIFDSSPISRSQAKRICSRLEQFKEVEFDFEGVDFMGQGFAHEIFYVFANANPQIKLIPLNMNEAVSKMYGHVLPPKGQ